MDLRKLRVDIVASMRKQTAAFESSRNLWLELFPAELAGGEHARYVLAFFVTIQTCTPHR